MPSGCAADIAAIDLRRRRAVRAGRPQHRGGGRACHAAHDRRLRRRARPRRAVRPRDLDRAAVLVDGRGRRCGRQCRQAGGVRHQAQPARDRLRLHQGGGGRRAGRAAMSRASSKSPTLKPPRPISRPAISTGIPASSCSAPAPCATPSRVQPEIWSATRRPGAPR